MGYPRFLAMIATSTMLMYGLTYLNTWDISHVRYSQTRLWMALLMGAMMTVVMLGFMRAMYRDRRMNRFIVASAAAVFLASLALVRSQVTVGDIDYMRAMIPHHSIAILTSRRAALDDPRVADLARRIVAAQQAEIAEMERLIADLAARPEPSVP